MTKPAFLITIAKNGPYMVSGGLPLAKQTISVDRHGGSERWIEGQTFAVTGKYSLCRCGNSANKPFCDGTHAKVRFDGTETATRAAYREQAQLLDGPVMQLADAEILCAFARFCDPNGQVWNQVSRTNEAPARATFLRQVGNCPSGRLVAVDKKDGRAVEPQLPPSIGVIEDPAQECSGPLWARGGIPIVSSNGFEYEVRNRVTLCRCGQSKNKPFCDGTHAAVKFRDY